jgi:hypothetical protein
MTAKKTKAPGRKSQALRADRPATKHAPAKGEMPFTATEAMRDLDVRLTKLFRMEMYVPRLLEDAPPRMVAAYQRCRDAAREAYDMTIKDVLAKHRHPGLLGRPRGDASPDQLIELAVIAQHSGEAERLLTLKILQAAGFDESRWCTKAA